MIALSEALLVNVKRFLPWATHPFFRTQLMGSFSRSKRDAIEQLDDDLPTLEQSLLDFDSADPLYHPGPYWKKHQTPLISYLRRHGLTDMRLGTRDKRDPKYIFRRFGAAEPATATPADYKDEAWQTKRIKFAKEYGARTGAKSLSSLSFSRAGNPGDVFSFEGNDYTSMGLSYYIRYAYLCQFVDFDKISVIVEIGPGGGIQTEMLHKLYPHLTSYLFDIPPQSYICTQYLKAALPGHVKGIKETRNATNLPEPKRGEVHIFNSWQIGLVKGTPIDLFWNAASFNEMEPHLVQNYLSIVKPTAKTLYLMSIMEGSRVGMNDYLSFLPDFEPKGVDPLIDHAGRKSDQYANSVWTRK